MINTIIPPTHLQPQAEVKYVFSKYAEFFPSHLFHVMSGAA